MKAVFNGEFTVVSYMGDVQSVFIKHGKYFTVYSNLASANVKRGDKVTTGQVIGKAGEDDNGQGAVDFILMNGFDYLDPQNWLHR